MPSFEKILAGGDIRSIGKCNAIVAKISNQADFDTLFKLMFSENRLLSMRSADAIEKITVEHPQYLKHHKEEILDLCKHAKNKELKWHLALLVPRLPIESHELYTVWLMLTDWAMNKANSCIVRVNAMQGLYELSFHSKALRNNLNGLMQEIETEHIPAIDAHIKKLHVEVKGVLN